MNRDSIEEGVETTLEGIVEPEAHGKRLDKVLNSMLDRLKKSPLPASAELSSESFFEASESLNSQESIVISRQRLQGLIKENAVQVNGKVETKPSFTVKTGDQIILILPPLQAIPLEPESIPLDVIYEDSTLLVINKPSGMLTHPSGRERNGTLVNALLAHCGDSLSGINGMIRPGIVHRLDRETSGLLMVAKTDAAHHHLSEQLKDKTAGRQYRAIVQSTRQSLNPSNKSPFTAETGLVNAAIGRDLKKREKMAVVKNGRSAVTHWQVMEKLGDRYALLTLRLETGRTHQIRVHMAHIGCPLLGDPLYGAGLEIILKLNTHGQLLQAFRLSFNHPISQERMTFEIPQDPEITRIWQHLEESTFN